jgi:beta-phosphoglucomutase
MDVELRKKGILFDFDGVTVKSMEQHFEGWRRAFSEFGITLKKEEFFPLEGQGIDTISAAIGAKYNLGDDEIKQAVKKKIYYYNKIMHIEFYDHFFDMLENLKRKKLKMGVVTGGSRDRVLPMVEQYLSSYFEIVVTIDDVERGKPHPDPYLKGAELLGLRAEECIAVENAPLGIKSGLSAGMTVIGITTTVSAETLKGAHYILADFYAVEKKILELAEV